jgi:hypothetical protein
MAILAELKSKLDGYQTAGVRYADAEDPLTASIFESIEVMDRQLALGTILHEATGDQFSLEDLAAAKFEYWMHDREAFGDETEPDLIITVGDCLYLLEAKYRSRLGQGTDEGPGQLEREWKGGMALTEKRRLSQFRLVCDA